MSRIGSLVWRAVRLRCPHCGGPGVFQHWFRMRRQCPSCHLDLERGEQGYQVGAYLFNIAAAELVWVAAMVTVAVTTWPNPPWDALLIGGVALMIALPIAFYPWSKALFLAFDLAFRPRGTE